MPEVNGQAKPAQTERIETWSYASEFHLLRARDVRLFEHSEGVAVTDRDTGAVTVLDADLVRSAYHLVTRRDHPAIDARLVSKS